MPQLTYIAPESCAKTSGILSVNNDTTNSVTVSLNNGQSCTANSFGNCIESNIPFGSYILEVVTDCNPQVSFINVNGQTAQLNGTSYFNITTDINFPNIDVNIICINT